MAKSQISMQLYAGNTTRGRMLMNAGEANGGPAFRQLVRRYINQDLQRGVKWKSQAVGALAYAFGEYLVEVLRKSHFMVWGPKSEIQSYKLRAVTGTLSTSITTEVTPLRTTEGNISKMSADIVITHDDRGREEQSSLLSGMSIFNEAGFPVIRSGESVSDYSSRALNIMFSMPTGRLDAQELWLDMVQTHFSPYAATTFLEFPEVLNVTNAEAYEGILSAMQITTEKLRAENRDLIEQSAMARWQAHSDAEEASTRSGNSRKRRRR